MSNSLVATWRINGEEVNAPTEHLDIQIIAEFDESSVQATLEIEQLTFVNRAAEIIRNWITDGQNQNGFGVFEGIPFDFSIKDDNNDVVVFEGYIDAADDYFQVKLVEVKAKIKKDNNVFTFLERARAVTYGFLLDRNDVNGSITSDDFFAMPYLVEKKNNPLELTMMGIATFLMVKELIEAVKDLAKDVANVITIATGGAPLAGLASSFVLALAQTLIQAAYTVIIAIAVVRMIKTFIEQFISPIRFHQTILYKTLLERGAAYLGYGFETSIKELDFLYFLPSKPAEVDPIAEGIPKPDDFGYTVGEAFEYWVDKTEGQIAIIDNVVHLRPKNDPFWVKNSTFILRGTLPLSEQLRLNTIDLKANILISFRTDVADSWTLDNFKGTNFEIITSPKNISNDQRVLMKGLDLWESPYALANRKDELNLIEEIIKTIAGIADELISFFGGRSVLSKAVLNSIKGRIGMLKVSQNFHTVAKLVPIKNNRIPANHREIWSAKVLWDSYINFISFVENDFGGQKKQLRENQIPFDFPSFLKLIDNKYFTTFEGQSAEALKISWAFNKGVATIDADVREVYTKNLQETKVEPE